MLWRVVVVAAAASTQVLLMEGCGKDKPAAGQPATVDKKEEVVEEGNEGRKKTKEEDDDEQEEEEDEKYNQEGEKGRMVKPVVVLQKPLTTGTKKEMMKYRNKPVRKSASSPVGRTPIMDNPNSSSSVRNRTPPKKREASPLPPAEVAPLILSADQKSITNPPIFDPKLYSAKGLRGIAQSCFFAAPLQLLTHSAVLRKAVAKKVTDTTSKERITPLQLALVQMFNRQWGTTAHTNVSILMDHAECAKGLDETGTRVSEVGDATEAMSRFADAISTYLGYNETPAPEFRVIFPSGCRPDVIEKKNGSSCALSGLLNYQLKYQQVKPIARETSSLVLIFPYYSLIPCCASTRMLRLLRYHQTRKKIRLQSVRVPEE